MSILIGNPYIDKNCSKKTITSTFVKKRILNDLKNILKHLGIKVIQIDNNNLCNVLWMRDLFFKIDNKTFLCNNTNSDTLKINRQNEKNLVIKYLKNYIYLPKNIKIEGGDIIQDKNNIFIGINERTNIAAYNYLKKTFPHKNIIKINHNTLHLDCCLTIVDNIIFYSKTYIKCLPNNLKKNYTIIVIEDILCNCEPNLATNILIINKNIITTDTPEFKPFRILLTLLDYKVYTIKYNNLLEESGGIRCLTQWL
jgi:N-dimethylarginine dimethylaminohydrolase